MRSSSTMIVISLFQKLDRKKLDKAGDLGGVSDSLARDKSNGKELLSESTETTATMISVAVTCQNKDLLSLLETGTQQVFFPNLFLVSTGVEESKNLSAC